MPQVVEAEVFDPGTLLCLVLGGRALLDAFAAEGETPAQVLSSRRFERRHGVRVQRSSAPVARLRRAVIKPGHFPVEIHASLNAIRRPSIVREAPADRQRGSDRHSEVFLAPAYLEAPQFWQCSAHRREADASLISGKSP